MPAPLAALSILFEVKLGERYVQYHYYPKQKNRLIKSGADVFVSLARLECITKAEHIPKLRRKV